MTTLSPEVMAALSEAATVCRSLSLARHIMARLTPERVAMKCANDILALAESPAFIDKIANARAETPDVQSENSDELLVEALLALKEEGKIGQEELDATLDMENGRLRRLAGQLKAKNFHSEAAH
jgi:hypothetical protein